MALYGPVGPNCAPYSVSLDGDTPTNYSATKQFYRPQQMLYQASNLGGKNHKLLIQSTAGNYSALYFAVDYAMVYTTPSLQRYVLLCIFQAHRKYIFIQWRATKAHFHWQHSGHCPGCLFGFSYPWFTLLPQSHSVKKRKVELCCGTIRPSICHNNANGPTINHSFKQ